MHSRLICTQWLHCLSTNIGILRQQPKQQHEIVEVGGLAGAAGHAASPRPAAPHSAIRPHALSVQQHTSQRHHVGVLRWRHSGWHSSDRIRSSGGGSAAQPDAPTPPLKPSASVYVEGYLYRAGNGDRAWNSTWKRRWVTLESDPSIGFRVLLYYAECSSPKPRGAILLADVALALPSDDDARASRPSGACALGGQRPCTFYLKSSTRTYTFAAESGTELLRWLRPLSLLVKGEPGLHAALQQLQASAAAAEHHGSDACGSSGGGGDGASAEGGGTEAGGPSQSPGAAAPDAAALDAAASSAAAPSAAAVSTHSHEMTWRVERVPKVQQQQPPPPPQQQQQRDVLINLRAVTIAVAHPAARVVKFEYHLSRLATLAVSSTHQSQVTLAFNDGRSFQYRFESAREAQSFCAVLRGAWQRREPPGASSSEAAGGGRRRGMSVVSWLGARRSLKTASDSISVRVCTFNLGNGAPSSPEVLAPWLRPEARCSIYAIAAQECYFEPVVGGRDCEGDWIRMLSLCLGGDYDLLTSVSMREIRLVIFVARAVAHEVTHVETSHKGTGIGGLGNKGAVAASMQVRASSLCFVGCHLAARPERIAERNGNYTDILECLRLGRKEFELGQQFHHVFLAGDLNYRVELPFEEAKAHAESSPPELAPLLGACQLKKEKEGGRTLQGFREAPITFAPTYKCHVGKHPGHRTYANKRDQAPSFTDRVLHYSMPRCESELQVTSYDAAPTITLSDHTPVAASYELKLRAPPKPEPAAHVQLRLSELKVLLQPPKMLAVAEASGSRKRTSQKTNKAKRISKLPRISLAGARLSGNKDAPAARISSAGRTSAAQKPRISFAQGAATATPRKRLTPRALDAGPVQLACCGTFLESGKFTVSDEIEVVLEDDSTPSDAATPHAVPEDSVNSEASMSGAPAGRPERLRHMAEVVLHPTVTDRAYLRQQHLLVLCRRGRKLLGGAVIPLADASGSAPVPFECTVSLRGHPTATISGELYLSEKRDGSAVRKMTAGVRAGVRLANRLRSVRGGSVRGGSVTVRGGSMMEGGTSDKSVPGLKGATTGATGLHIATPEDGAPDADEPVRVVGDGTVRKWLVEARESTSYQAKDYSFGGQEPTLYRRGTLWHAIEDEDDDDGRALEMSAASTEAGRAVVAPGEAASAAAPPASAVVDPSHVSVGRIASSASELVDPNDSARSSLDMAFAERSSGRPSSRPSSRPSGPDGTHSSLDSLHEFLDDVLDGDASSSSDEDEEQSRMLAPSFWTADSVPLEEGSMMEPSITQESSGPRRPLWPIPHSRSTIS